MPPSHQYTSADTALATAIIAILSVHFYWKFWGHVGARKRPLPPGPTPLPVIGNLLHIPKSEPWKGYCELSKRYGNIVALRAMGRCIIILNDVRTAVELFEKRSSVYSSRPQSAVIEQGGWDWQFAIMPYGSQWRDHRRLVSQHYHQGAIGLYRTSQEESARRLLVSILDNPGEVIKHIRYAIGSHVVKMTYGLETTSKDDKYINAFEDSVAFLDLLVSGSSILEFFPFLAKVPTWTPVVGPLLQRLAEARATQQTIRILPWVDAKEAYRLGSAPASMTSAVLERLSHLSADEAAAEEEVAKSAFAMSYGAALDTTEATMGAFFFAMSQNPVVQEKAGRELDAVVGSSRLPELMDRGSLPYVNAVVKETMRWHSVTPLGLPHVSTLDDEYNGYFIPKNSILMANIWAMMHDPEMFPEPEKFMPERFLRDGQLNSEVLDPAEVVFGFGRRICVGRHFADASLFIYIASVLHTLDISPVLDDKGRATHIKLEVTDGVASHIVDCRCTIKPRSTSTEALIRSSVFGKALG